MRRTFSTTGSLAALATLSVLALTPFIGCGGGDDAVESNGPGAAGAAGDDGGTDSSTDGDAHPLTCNHDGKVQAPEECDDGNMVDGDGCNNDCNFSCHKSSECDDKDPCNGTETCDSAKHACTKAPNAADGTSCGTDKACHAGVCGDITCGDSFVDTGEECDDGNVTDGDGCDSCKFSCVSTDATRNCKSTDACQADGTCDDAKHTCTAGASQPDGTTCSGGICKSGMCVSAQCGDGIVGSGEECDFGAGNGAGTGCEVDCKFSCTKSPDSCTTADPCGGTNACADVTVNGASGQACQPGTPPAEGSSCGSNGEYCKGGVCTSPQCGNGVVDPGEACDDGNPTDGDGCDSDCTFSCTNAASDCAAAPKCEKNQCDANHKCEVVADASQDNQACGAPNLVCKAGACVAPNAVCGNGTVETGEQCDFGNGNGAGTGCETNCKFSCTTNPNSCADANPCNGAETCGQVTVNGKTGQKCSAGTSQADGTTCGNGAICLGGACKNSTCGDGYVDTAGGEKCDLGANNSLANGCDPTTCQYACNADADCADANTCNGAEKCTTTTSGSQTVKKCTAGTNAADCTACTGGGVCKAGSCASSTCGDTCIDASKGEQCEPPSTATCDAQCHTVAKAVCGNGKREAGEQCDDGNTTNTDGCDAKCQFEQEQRVNWLQMQFGTDSGANAFCTANALGKAITLGLAQDQINNAGAAPNKFISGVQDGSINVLFDFLNPLDLTGTSGAVKFGAMTGALGPAYTAGFDGTKDLDWWYTPDPSSLDAATRLPLAAQQISGTFASKVLTANNANLTIVIVISGTPGNFRLTGAKMTAAIGSTSAPTIAAGTNPPGHLAAENLDPALKSFQTMGQSNANGAAKLCGNVTAASLKQVAVPSALTSGLTACSQNYSTSNSLLDVIVGGCTVLFQTAIAKTQPDATDPSAPLAGAGPQYTLSANSSKVVTTCKDKNGATVDLNTCLASAAYSTYFKFSTDRVILK